MVQDHEREQAAEYLIREIPKGILMWYPFKENAKILVVDASNVDTAADLREMFDDIIVTAIWEKAQSPETLFSRLYGKLNDGGKLWILMNNRLGLRYFCGDKDPYTNTVVDCLEGYLNADPASMEERMYDKAEVCRMLDAAGVTERQFFSVWSDLENPALIYSEDYVPNENITNRVTPTYHNPDTVFVEEKTLYHTLVENHLLHALANAYLIEGTKDGILCDVMHVTSSLERGTKDALFTIIHRSGIVEKKAAYPEGLERLSRIDQNCRELSARGIDVVEGKLDGNSFSMPFLHAQTVQLYLGQVLRKDVELFLREMDRFRDLILQSSELEKADEGDGEGAVLRYGYLDMVPLNSFYMDGKYVFFDQEFREEHYPANTLFWRLIATFYAADPGAEALYPRDRLLERYGLMPQLSKWQNMEWDFLKALRNEKVLEEYHKTNWADHDNILRNRVRMNESEAYRRKTYEDIFNGIEGKNLLLFGTGKYAARFREQYGNDFPIYAMLDNNAEKVGTSVDGIKIVCPEYLVSLPQGSYKVMICIRDYQPIIGQLEGMGVKDYSVYDPNRYYQTRPRTSIRIVEGNGSSKAESAEPAAGTGPRKKYAVGYVAGAFDMFHIGHLNLLRNAKQYCDYLIVGVMSDEKMFDLKHKYPVIPCKERMQVVAGCRYADRVEELSIDRAGIRDAYHMFHFDCMFSGDDHSTDSGWLSEQAYLREQGSDIFFFPYTKETNSTEIRNKILENGKL